MSASPLRATAVFAVLLAAAVTSLPAQSTSPARYFTVEQARFGAHEYTAYCAGCHGADLRGPQLPLAGPSFASLGHDTGMTLGQFFEFVVRDTPAGSLKSLSHDQYAAIMAYIMQQNGYAAGTQPLRYERAMQLSERIAAQPKPR